MSFFKTGEQIINNILEIFNQKGFEYCFLAGGGYGYDSKKYLESSNIGDLDLICLTKNLGDIKKIISNKSFLESLGYEEFNETYRYFKQDIDLFSNGIISIIRFSGKIQGIKTSINFSTIDRIKKQYSDNKPRSLYKIAHSKTYTVIIGKSTHGNGKTIALISPEYSIFQDNRQHWIVPDYTWFQQDGEIYLGLITDFIAKGKILKDTLKQDLLEIQNKILITVIKNTSDKLIQSGEWYKVFASNEYFGKEYKKKFMFRMKDLLSKILPIIPHEHVFHDYLDNQVICVFARRDFYSSNFLIQKSFGSNVVENIDEILKREMINQDTYMIILNGEIKRLSGLISNILTTQKKCPLPVNMGINNLFIDYNNDIIGYRNLKTTLADPLIHFIKSIYIDYITYKNISIKGGKKLFMDMLSIRIGILLFIIKYLKIDVETLLQRVEINDIGFISLLFNKKIHDIG